LGFSSFSIGLRLAVLSCKLITVGEPIAAKSCAVDSAKFLQEIDPRRFEGGTQYEIFAMRK